MNVETRSAIRDFQKQQNVPGAEEAVDSSGEPAASDGGTNGTQLTSPAASDSAQPNGGEEQQEYDEFEFFDDEFDDFEFYDDEFDDFELEGEVNRHSAEYIKWAQRSLNKILSLRLAVDGVNGPMTRSAIRSFQQKQGLTADGIVGPVTESALIRAGAGSPPQKRSGLGSYFPRTATPTTGKPDIVNVRGIEVAKQIAPQVEALLAVAAADGVRLSGGGYRSSDEQIRLRIKNCGGNTPYNIYEKPSSQCDPPTAPPGKSNHEKGLAIDFRYNGQGIETRNNPGFIWLNKNASKYGLYNLPSEPWHWSVNGK